MSRFSGPTVPQFTRTSSHAGIGTYHIMIHAYFHKQWFAGNVIEKFKTAGIELNAVERVKEADYIPMGLSIKECLKFEKASVNNFIASGCIITLNTVDDLNKLKEHYLTLNAKGEFYTWSFSKDNVLIVLSGNMAEEEARQFEKALYNL
ncbi:MAG: hypothetical protein HY809_03405 [Nitrospirae bacterium]|nr:hypothetical protein [Nitrospirota bacterium]